jgi:hypothetical protein
MKSPELEKIEFAKTHKDLYSATSKIKEVDAERATFLSIEGQGEPGGAAFQSAIERMYSMAYTTKFSLKKAGKLDFGVSRLECLWHGDDFEHTPRSQWRWQLLIRIPNAVTEKDLKLARAEIREKRGIDASAVKRWTWAEGRCIQVLHVGPYDKLGRTYSGLDEFARASGLATACPGHEIYISDPRRVPPAKLKTIVRLPISGQSPKLPNSR